MDHRERVVDDVQLAGKQARESGSQEGSTDRQYKRVAAKLLLQTKIEDLQRPAIGGIAGQSLDQ